MEQEKSMERKRVKKKDSKSYDDIFYKEIVLKLHIPKNSATIDSLPGNVIKSANLKETNQSCAASPICYNKNDSQSIPKTKNHQMEYLHLNVYKESEQNPQEVNTNKPKFSLDNVLTMKEEVYQEDKHKESDLMASPGSKPSHLKESCTFHDHEGGFDFHGKQRYGYTSKKSVRTPDRNHSIYKNINPKLTTCHSMGDAEESSPQNLQHIPQIDRLRNYDTLIFKSIKSGHFDSVLLESLQFELYNESTFIILEEDNFWKSTLIRGSRGFLKMKRKEILIKEALLNTECKDKPKAKFNFFPYPEHDQEHWMLADKASSNLREKEILDLLKSKNDKKHFTECEGKFFKTVGKGEVASILLLTTIGDANLSQIREKRKLMKKYYSEEEVLKIFGHMVSGLRRLQEARIYHSNIKLSKIYLDVSGNTYILLDFSFAKTIPIGEDPSNKDVIKIQEYGRSGSEGYNSPEKAEAWNLMKSSRKLEDYKFNPFKDDLWNLGVCLQELRKFTNIPAGESKLDLILSKMLMEDWHLRPDPIELDDFLQKEMGLNEPLIVSEEEKQIAKEIKKDRILRISDPKIAYKRLEEAQLIEEQKEFLRINLERSLLERNLARKLEFEAWLYYQNGKLLTRLGEKHEALKKLEEALRIYKKELGRNKSLEVAQVHLINFQIYIDFGDFQKAAAFIQKALDMQISIANYSTFPEYINHEGKMWQSIKGNYRTIAMTFRERAKLYCILGQYERAWCEYERAIKFFDFEIESAGNIEAKLEKIRTKIEMYFIIGKKECNSNIEELVTCIDSIKEIFLTNDHLDVAKAYYYIAIQQAQIGKYNESLNNINETLKIYSKILNDDHPDVKNAENWRAYLENLQDKPGSLQLIKEISKKPVIDKPEPLLQTKGSLDIRVMELEIPLKKVLLDYSEIAPVNEMTEQIGNLAKTHSLTNFIENLNIKRYPKKTFKKLQLLGKGNFAEVWRGIDLNTRKTIALKFVFLGKSLEHIKKKETASLAGLLREKDILDKLRSLKSQCFCELLDIYYLNTEENLEKSEKPDKISAFVLVTTAGDCSLENLQSFRNTKNPYNKSEVLQIVKDLSEALDLLRNLKIYHSDIKPQNIVYNADLKKYQLIDFGVSRIIEDKPLSEGDFENTYLVPMELYANSGTRLYHSPEKIKFWSLANNIQGEEDEEKYISMVFDPFKCDIYSLGKTIADLLPQSELKDLDFISEMMNEDYKSRISAKDLYKKISNQRIDPNQSHPDPNYLVEIEKNRWKTNFKMIYEKYDRAFMPVEQLALVEEELRQAKDQARDNPTSSQETILEIKFRRGLTLKKLGNLIEAQNQFDDILTAREKLKSGGNENKDLSNTLLALAAISSERGEYQKTENYLNRALQILKENPFSEESNSEVLKVLQEQAIQKGNIGDYGWAADKLQNILDSLIESCQKKVKKSSYAAITNVMIEQAKQWSRMGQHARAINQMENVLKIRIDVLGTEIHPDVAAVMSEIANLKIRSRNYDKDIFLEYLQKVLAIKRSLYKSDSHPTIAETIYSIAQVQYLKGDTKNALIHFKEVIEKYKNIYRNDHHPSIFCAKAWYDYISDDTSSACSNLYEISISPKKKEGQKSGNDFIY